GYDGGGAGGADGAGGGGGASEVRTGVGAQTLSCGLAARVLVGGGGGGSTWGTPAGDGAYPSGGAGAYGGVAGLRRPAGLAAPANGPSCPSARRRRRPARPAASVPAGRVATASFAPDPRAWTLAAAVAVIGVVAAAAAGRV